MNDREDEQDSQSAAAHHMSLLEHELYERERLKWHDDLEQRNRTIAEPQPTVKGLTKGDGNANHG